MNLLLNGGNTTSSRALVELVYLVVAAAIGAGAQYVLNTPEAFSVQWVIAARLVLGILANLANPQVKNT